MLKGIGHIAVVCVFAIAACARAGSVVNDASLGSAPVAHSGNIFTIGPSSGKQVGTNLFFSLSTLNLDKGETANFTGPSSITNVLTRVTGGPSTIDGTLQCSIANANFLLINPQGVVFGPDASLNVSGSFVVTTADQLKLADGQVFAALPAATDATLTTAAPAAFGFLASSPAGFTVDGATLSVSSCRSFVAATGPVTISGGSIQAPAGAIAVGSVASSGTVQLNGQTIGSLASFTSPGPIQITDGQIDTSGSGGGRIVIRGGAMTLEDSTISANTTGPGSGMGINIQLAKDLVSTNGAILSETSSSGRAGDISVTAADISATGQNSAKLGLACADSNGGGIGG
ncbi:MAG: filamentous hemagglutinin N-terminal domain-containing protein, partial [Tepidisphaeraceae bacterium]